jgi:hypothetical protein
MIGGFLCKKVVKGLLDCEKYVIFFQRVIAQPYIVSDEET